MRGTAKTAQHGYRSPESHPGRVLFFQARYLVITPYHPGRVLFFQANGPCTPAALHSSAPPPRR